MSEWRPVIAFVGAFFAVRRNGELRFWGGAGCAFIVRHQGWRADGRFWEGRSLRHHLFIFLFSGKPIATILRFAGIIGTVGIASYMGARTPLVAGSRLFGIGLLENGWQSGGVLVGSASSMWLELPEFGIPGSLFGVSPRLLRVLVGSVEQGANYAQRKNAVSARFLIVISC